MADSAPQSSALSVGSSDTISIGESSIPSSTGSGAVAVAAVAAATDSVFPAAEIVLKDTPDGEINVLMQSLEEEEERQVVPLAEQTRTAIKKTLSGQLISDSGEAVYGRPLSVEEAAERMPPGEGGMMWHASVVPDIYFIGGKLLRGLRPRDFDMKNQTIKPRRAVPTLTVSDLLSSLTKIGPRYIFYGILNGWPSLRCFELIGIEQKRAIGWNKVWRADKEGAKGIPLRLDKSQIYRVTLRGAPWTSHGWSKDSPGFLFWYEAQRSQGPRMSYGTDTLHTIDDATCTHIHMVSHRYAVKHESPRDLITYHSICLLEWDHGQYATVVETAFLNGIGGYNGRSNWYHDKDELVNQLFRNMPPEMISPWRSNSAEVRCYDVKAKNLEELMMYMHKYKGNTQRFIDPQISFSHRARLTFRSRRHIAQYLLNYISRDSSYAELKRNCQTFTADLCCFIAGKKVSALFNRSIHGSTFIDFELTRSLHVTTRFTLKGRATFSSCQPHGL